MQFITYEQCPWDLDHVSQIYRSIKDFKTDGDWHEIPGGVGSAWYRIWDQRIFTMIVFEERNELLEEVMAGPPPLSEEDAEWTLVKHPRGDYSIGSEFSRTFGRFDVIEEVNDWLNPFGLGLEEFNGDSQGFAFFESLEPECWLDAMERLRFLEAVCLDANRAANMSLKAVWGSIRRPLMEASKG